MANVPNPEELIKIGYKPPATPWMDDKVEFKKGSYCNAGIPKWLEVLDYPYPRTWSVTDEDWNLPENWKEIFLDAFEDRLNRYRSLRLFMGYMRQMRRLRRQVPLFYWRRRSQKHARSQGRIAEVHIQAILHDGR